MPEIVHVGGLPDEPRDGASKHKLPQLSASHLAGDLHGQHMESQLRITPAWSQAQGSTGVPICEGLGMPLQSMSSHGSASFAQRGHRTSSHDGWDGRSFDEGSSDGSENTAIDESKVADHPIPGRPSKAGSAGKASEQVKGRRQQGREGQLYVGGDFYRGTMHMGWIAYEVILCSLMLTCIALLFYYAFQLQPKKAPTERRVAVYDSVDIKARPFLLRRKFNGTDGNRRGMPGAAGRWAEGKESEAGLHAFANMMEALEQMTDVKIAYTLIQGFALVLLLVRFVIQTSFQPKLSVISGTLARSVADIIYFLFIFLASETMISCMLTIVFGGGSYSGVSSLSECMLVVFNAIIAGSDASLMHFLSAAANGDNGFSNTAMFALAWVFMVIISVFFLFLMVVIIAIIMRPYARLRQGSMDAPGIHTDLAALFLWLRLTFKGHPSGPELSRLVKYLLHEKKEGEKPHLASSLSQIVTRLSRKHFPSIPSARTDNPADQRVSAADHHSQNQALSKLRTLSRIMSGRRSSTVVPEPSATCISEISEIADKSMQQRATTPAVSGAIPRKPFLPQAVSGGRSLTSPQVTWSCPENGDQEHRGLSPSTAGPTSLQQQPSTLSQSSNFLAQRRRTSETGHNSGKTAGWRKVAALQAMLSMHRQSPVRPSNVSLRVSPRLKGPEQQSGGHRASENRRVSFMGDDPHNTTTSDSDKVAEAGSEDGVVRSAWTRVQAVLGTQHGGQVMKPPGKGNAEEGWQEKAQKERVVIRTLLQGGFSQSRKRRAGNSQALQAEGAAAADGNNSSSSLPRVRGWQGDTAVTEQLGATTTRNQHPGPAFTHVAASSGALPPSAAQAKLSSSSMGEGDMVFEGQEVGQPLGMQGGQACSCVDPGSMLSSTRDSFLGVTGQQQQQQQQQQQPWHQSPVIVVWRLITETEESFAMLDQLQVTAQHLQALACTVQALLQHHPRPSSRNSNSVDQSLLQPARTSFLARSFLDGQPLPAPHSSDSQPAASLPLLPAAALHHLYPDVLPTPRIALLKSLASLSLNAPGSSLFLPLPHHPNLSLNLTGISAPPTCATWQPPTLLIQGGAGHQQNTHAHTPKLAWLQQQQRQQQRSCPQHRLSSQELHIGQLQPQPQRSTSVTTKWASQRSGSTRRESESSKRVSWSVELTAATHQCSDEDVCTGVRSNEVRPFACGLPTPASDGCEQSARPVVPESRTASPSQVSVGHTQPDADAGVSLPAADSLPGMPFRDNRSTPFGSRVSPTHTLRSQPPRRARSMSMLKLPPTIVDEDESSETQHNIPGTIA